MHCYGNVLKRAWPLLTRKLSHSAAGALSFPAFLREGGHVSTAEIFSRNEASPALEYMPLYFSEIYHVVLPDGHRFPMSRYRAVRDIMQSILKAASHPIRYTEPPIVALQHLLLAHDEDYVLRYLNNQLSKEENRIIGFPWSEAFALRTFKITGGTVQAAYDVMNAPFPAIACNQAGGTHHAFRSSGEGFCIFNDIAVAANVLLQHSSCRDGRILVIDVDVHQGNGTAAICADNPKIITFSMHGAKNYPWRTRHPSTLDIDVPDGAGDDVFNRLLEDGLKDVDRLCRNEAGTMDVKCVFFQAGVDPLMYDRLGRLKLTRSGLHTRNDIIYRWCEARNLPVVVTMGGGYATPIELSARCHADVFMQAAASWKRRKHTHESSRSAIA